MCQPLPSFQIGPSLRTILNLLNSSFNKRPIKGGKDRLDEPLQVELITSHDRRRPYVVSCGSKTGISIPRIRLIKLTFRAVLGSGGIRINESSFLHLFFYETSDGCLPIEIAAICHPLKNL